MSRHYWTSESYQALTNATWNGGVGRRWSNGPPRPVGAPSGRGQFGSGRLFGRGSEVSAWGQFDPLFGPSPPVPGPPSALQPYPPSSFQRSPPGPMQQYPSGPMQQYLTGPMQQYPTGPMQQYPSGSLQQYPSTSKPCYPRTRGNSRPRGHSNGNACSPNGSAPLNRTLRSRSLASSTTNFYRVTLHRCRNYEKVILYGFIKEQLDASSRDSFQPLGPRVTKSDWEFCINNFKLAQRIYWMSGKITLPDGSKLKITVKPTTPLFALDELAAQTITLVLKSLYNPAINEADLSNFQNNDVFVSREMICSLHLDTVLVNVTDILFTIAPDLEVLKLDDNNLISLEETGNSLARFESLKTLHLANNNIRSFRELRYLSSLKLEVLVLTGNGLEKKFEFRADYVKEIRDMFPTMKVLDGEVLPKQVDFDLGYGDNGTLPNWVPRSVGPTVDLHMLSNSFVREYFKLYDEPGRQNLRVTYDDDAVLSLKSHVEIRDGISYSMVSAYQDHNRNLLLAGMRDPVKLEPLLYKGPTKIVEVFQSLPATIHLTETFTCDCLGVITGVSQVVVAGLFREFGAKSNVTGKPLKSFTRCFLIRKTECGFKIINDSFVIRYPSRSQFATVKKLEMMRNAPKPCTLEKNEPGDAVGMMDIDEAVCDTERSLPQTSPPLEGPHKAVDRNKHFGSHPSSSADPHIEELEAIAGEIGCASVTENPGAETTTFLEEVELLEKELRGIDSSGVPTNVTSGQPNHDETHRSERRAVKRRRSESPEGTTVSPVEPLRPSVTGVREGPKPEALSDHDQKISYLVNHCKMDLENATLMLESFDWNLVAIMSAWKKMPE